MFIGVSMDAKFRAFDSGTGKELWVTKLDASVHTVPITYQGKMGKAVRGRDGNRRRQWE